MIRETILKKATVFFRQDIEYETEAEKLEKISEIEEQASQDLNHMQSSGTRYDFGFDGIDEASQDFPYWIFVN